MVKNLKGLSICLVLAVAIGLIYWKGIDTKQLIPIKTKQVKQVNWTHASDKLALIQTKGRWQTSHRSKQHVMPSLIPNILSIMNHIEYARVIDTPENQLGKYGLKQPRLIIEVIAENKQLTLNIGQLNPSKEYFYVQSSEKEGVMLVSAQTIDAITPKNNWLVDKEIKQN